MSDFLEALSKLATTGWQKKLAFGVFVLFLFCSALAALKEASGFTLRDLASSPPASQLDSSARAEIQKRLRHSSADGSLSVDESHELEAFAKSLDGDGNQASKYFAEAKERSLRAAEEIREGLELAALGRFREARLRLREAIELDGDNSVSWANFGSVALELGDWSEAEAALRKALALEPQNRVANYNLGACFAVQKKPASALDHLERAVVPMIREGSAHEITALRADLLSSRHFESIRHTPRFEALLRRIR